MLVRAAEGGSEKKRSHKKTMASSAVTNPTVRRRGFSFILLFVNITFRAE